MHYFTCHEYMINLIKPVRWSLINYNGDFFRSEYDGLNPRLLFWSCAAYQFFFLCLCLALTRDTFSLFFFFGAWLAFCSTLKRDKPNSVNDKKGWSAHPSHLTPGAHTHTHTCAHTLRHIRLVAVLFATSGATITQSEKRKNTPFYTTCRQDGGAGTLNPAL